MNKRLIPFLFMIFLIGFVSAMSSPHGFSGKVYYSDGSTLMDSGTITAKIGDFEINSDINSDGLYDLVVESQNDGTVEFYFSGEIEAVEKYEFESFEVTELNIVTNIEALVVDDEINTNKNSGGGSSGSGSSSNSNENVIDLTPNVEDNQEDKQNEGEEISEKKEEITRENIDSGITGAVIGFAKSGKGIVTLVFATLIVVAGGMIAVVRKVKLKKSNSSVRK